VLAPPYGGTLRLNPVVPPANYFHQLLLERTLVFSRPARSSRLDAVDVMASLHLADRPLEIRIDETATVPAPGMLPWYSLAHHRRLAIGYAGLTHRRTVAVRW